MKLLYGDADHSYIAITMSRQNLKNLNLITLKLLPKS
jgi:hypothetical protein